ncbi:MAG: hemolysin III family protein [Alteromonas sp.]|nr:hemolysin III family protein [Alteromonas sp.]MAY21447.1 hemolysin III family protein [Flavobacteriaceae bacterium]|tara:strand:+ start:82 stop:702 length:621 start_codon:yes stop_codon:yes gene_type:complete
MYTKEEELWNIITHGAGVLLSLLGVILLLLFNERANDFSILSIILYSGSLLFLYSASTLYHLVTKPRLKHFFRKLDHIGIYFLIAGTYTPVALISLVDTSGWTIFWTVWIIAIIGTLLKIFFTGKFEKLSLLLYLAMGWLIVFDLQNVWNLHSALGITLLGLGGVFYTLGTIFYANDKIPYNHAIWHCFVLAGSISHFCFIFFDIL